MPGFNQQIKQVLILALLIAIILLALRELYLFLPGLLGALTLYILSRGSYFQMIYNRKKKKGQSAALFILGYLLVLCLIIYLTVALLGPKVQPFFDHPSLLINMANKTIADIHQNTGIEFISENTTSDLMNRLTSFVPRLINNTVDLMINLILMLFMLYYMP